MLRRRIKRHLKRRALSALDLVDQLLGDDGDDRGNRVDRGADRPAPSAEPTPQGGQPVTARSNPYAPKVVPAPQETPAETATEEPVAPPAETATEEPVAQPVTEAPEPEESQEISASDTGLTYDAVQELFDEMVRPALQADGGDITLVKVEDDKVYVRLVGACSSCPSATVTMKMGIERLLLEEFPQVRELVQVDGHF